MTWQTLEEAEEAFNKLTETVNGKTRDSRTRNSGWTSLQSNSGWSTLQEAYDAFQGYIGSLEGVNSITQLAQGAGVVRIPDLLSGDTGDPRDTTNPFTGTFMVFPPITLPNGDQANIGGMNAGVIQWYGNSANGKLVAGAGSVVMDESGTTISSDGTIFRLRGEDGDERLEMVTKNARGGVILSASLSESLTVPNGGAEDGDMTGWTTDYGTISASSLQAKSGTYSFLLDGESRMSSTAFIDTADNRGAYISLWAYYNGSGSEPLGIQASFYNSSDVLLQTLPDITFQLTLAEWNEYTMLAQAPVGSTKIKLVITGTDIYIDDIQVWATSSGFLLMSGDGGLRTVGTCIITDGLTGKANIFNDLGLDSDTRIEGSTDENLVFVDASTDRVGIGTATPSVKLDVNGEIKATNYNSNGWITVSDTWTRTGNHVFTISGDVTSTYRKGAAVRYKDGGSFEYGVIYSSSHSAGTTTITLITNGDYAMAAATITDKYISYIPNPEGFPVWFNWTPTFTGFSADPAGTHRWVSISPGLMCMIIRHTANGTSNATTFHISLPCTASANSAKYTGPGQVVDNGAVPLTPANMTIAASDTKIIMEKDYGGTGWTNTGNKRLASGTVYMEY